MIRAKNYEKVSKFVKVTTKTLSVPFFRTRCRSPDDGAGMGKCPAQCKREGGIVQGSCQGNTSGGMSGSPKMAL